MGFILIDFKKREEHRQLKQLGPDMLKDYDRFVANYSETTPTEDECKAAEDAEIQRLIGKFDEALSKLKRVKEDHDEQKEQFVRMLNWKRGKLYLKFSDAVGALKAQALDILKQCTETFDSFEKELIASFPIAESEISKELSAFMASQTSFIEETYPEGVKGLDQFVRLTSFGSMNMQANSY